MQILQFLWQSVSGYTGNKIEVKSFSAFDGLRGYMAWWVVIGHALYFCGIDYPWTAFLEQGNYAVGVFICLSGFVITHLILEKKESYIPYIIRRGFRIFPIYWFALICAILLTPQILTANATLSLLCMHISCSEMVEIIAEGNFSLPTKTPYDARKLGAFVGKEKLDGLSDRLSTITFAVKIRPSV